MPWIVVSYRLPGKGSTARVTVWREARRLGALPLQRSVVVFPSSPLFRTRVERFRLLVSEQGGESMALSGDADTAADEQRLVELWNEARAEEYTELIAECGKFVREIEHEFAIEKFTLAELEEEEAELAKLEQWTERITERDVHGAANSAGAVTALAQARSELDRYATEIFKRSRG